MLAPRSEAVVGADVPPTTATKLTGIAILGSHPATVNLAPFDDPSWLIYACSPHNVEKRKLPRWDEWFEVHVPVTHQTRGQEYRDALKTFKHVWMRDPKEMGDYPGAKVYPEAALRGVGQFVKVKTRDGETVDWLVGIERGKFSYHMFTSTIAYMMALAIDRCERENIRTIGLWGIMQMSNYEYEYQKPGIHYFMDQAWARGIRVVAPDISGLFQPRPDDW